MIQFETSSSPLFGLEYACIPVHTYRVHTYRQVYILYIPYISMLCTLSSICICMSVHIWFLALYVHIHTYHTHSTISGSHMICMHMYILFGNCTTSEEEWMTSHLLSKMTESCWPKHGARGKPLCLHTCCFATTHAKTPEKSKNFLCTLHYVHSKIVMKRPEFIFLRPPLFVALRQLCLRQPLTRPFK